MAHFDLYRPNYPQEPRPVTSRKRGKFKWLVFILIIIAALGGVGYYALNKTNKIFTNKTNIFQRFGNFFISQDKPLIGEDLGEVNILLMGIGGEGHEGAHLTDTMIVANIDTKTNEVGLISIPRDFALNLPTYGYNRINAAYAYAFRDDEDTAGQFAMDIAESVTGLDISYFAVIDFDGFVKAVDNVGGLDVEIERTFTDSTFPNDKNGYLAPVTFTKGTEHMNGQRALIFARSRHADNSFEASDFARSERQKKVLISFKEKVLSLNITDLSTINNLLSNFTENFRTNMEPHEIKRLGDLAKNIQSDNIYSFSLEPDGVLICSALVDPQTGKPLPPPPPPAPAPTTPLPSTSPSPSPSNKPTATSPTPSPPPAPAAVPEVVRMYVIQPCHNKSFADIHDFLTNYLTVARLKKEGATIEVQNSTGRSYAASKFLNLDDRGLITKVGIFKGKLPFEQTVVYDNSVGTMPKTLDLLKTEFGLMVSDITYPTSTADFVIIVGRDQL